MTAGKLLHISAPAVLGMALVTSADLRAAAQEPRPEEKTIQLSEVPQAARDAAKNSLSTSPTEAKILLGTSPEEYELSAKDKLGKNVTVQVLGNGKVVGKRVEIRP